MQTVRKIDTHLHGYFSSDSNIDYHLLCRKALANGYTDLIFTDHYDLLVSEFMAYGVFSIHEYFFALKELKKAFPRLNILIGLEIGEPHRNQSLLKKIFKQYQPEYLIGSLHTLRSRINISMSINKPLLAKQVKEYYEENLEMCIKGGFDTLGHLGIFKRGLPYFDDSLEKKYVHIIDEIFREMIKKNICLEVNVSGFRNTMFNTIPEPKTLNRYKKIGGRLITIGSDAHDLEHFHQFHDKTLDILSEIGFYHLNMKNGDDWDDIPILR